MTAPQKPRRPLWGGLRWNPLLVRETRRMVRSRWIVNLFCLFLVGLVWVVMQMMIINMDTPNAFFSGEIMFQVILVVTSVAAAVTVLPYTAWQVVGDRVHEDPSLTTMLTPSQNVRGRLLCGLVVSLLFFSVSLPFLTVAYLHRGVSLTIFFVAVPVLLLLIQAANALTLAVFSAARSLFLLPFLGVLFLALSAAIGFFLYSFWEVIGEEIFEVWLEIHEFLANTADWRQYYYFIVFNLAFLFFIGIFLPVLSFQAARGNLSPATGNRVYPFRFWLTALILVALVAGLVDFVVTGVWEFKWRYRFLLLPWWMLGMTAILTVSILLAPCEREEWGPRLRREIPKPMWRRVLVFPLYTGSVNAVCWTILATLLYLFAAAASVTLSGGYYDWDDPFFYPLPLSPFRCAVFLLMMFDYSMLAFFLWKKGLHRWIGRSWIWAITLSLIAVAMLIGWVMTELFASYLGEGYYYYMVPLAAFFEADLEEVQEIVAVPLTILLLFIGIPWAMRRIGEFSPPASD